LVKSEVAEDRASNSVHVHINAQGLTMQQVLTWLAVYFIFEEQLVRWAGPHRIGNLFCLRARDAEGLIQMIRKAVKEDDFSYFSDDNYRYAAANVMALTKFGSLEFRALRGTVKKDVIQQWVDTLLSIKDKSLEYKDPIAVLADFSRRSPLGFTNHILPFPMSRFMLHQQDFQESLYDGARLVQDFAFQTEWQSRPSDKPKDLSPKKKTTIQPTWGSFNDQIGGTIFQHTTTQQPYTIHQSFIGIILQNHNGALKQQPTSPGETYSQIQIKELLVVSLMAAGNRKIGWRGWVDPGGESTQNRLAILSTGSNGLVRWIDEGDYNIVT